MNNERGGENSIQRVCVERTENTQCSAPGAGRGRKQGWEEKRNHIGNGSDLQELSVLMERQSTRRKKREGRETMSNI